MIVQTERWCQILIKDLLNSNQSLAKFLLSQNLIKF